MTPLDGDAIETKSARIRALAADGLSTSEIARQLGIRYQHAYNVLKGTDRSPPIVSVGEKPVVPAQPGKQALPVSVLINGGFSLVGCWSLTSTEELVVDQPLPKDVGVYAFVKEGVAVYVGVATMGISKRLYFYSRPGISQRTSQRLNETIKNELRGLATIEVYVAIPPDLEWNRLPVHGSAGLELGLIKKYALPWNMRSAG